MNKRPRKIVNEINIFGNYYGDPAVCFIRNADPNNPNYTGGYWPKLYYPTPASFRRCIRALELLTSPEFVR